MTLKEAFDALAAKYPGRVIRVNHWFDSEDLNADGSPREVKYIVVDGASISAKTFESAVENLKVPTPPELAERLRKQAAELLAKADALSQPTQ